MESLSGVAAPDVTPLGADRIRGVMRGGGGSVTFHPSVLKGAATPPPPGRDARYHRHPVGDNREHVGVGRRPPTPARNVNANRTETDRHDDATANAQGVTFLRPRLKSMPSASDTDDVIDDLTTPRVPSSGGHVNRVHVLPHEVMSTAL